jgi:hypothetical protein
MANDNIPDWTSRGIIRPFDERPQLDDPVLQELKETIASLTERIERLEGLSTEPEPQLAVPESPSVDDAAHGADDAAEKITTNQLLDRLPEPDLDETLEVYEARALVPEAVPRPIWLDEVRQDVKPASWSQEGWERAKKLARPATDQPDPDTVDKEEPTL